MTPPSVTLLSLDDWARKIEFKFEAIRSNVFRTTFTSKTHPLPPYGSVTRPKPYFSGPVDVETDVDVRTIKVGNVMAMVEWPLSPTVSLFMADESGTHLLHRDLPFRSYALDDWGVAHYMVLKKDTLHVGLGEKAAPMNLTGRGFIMSATDAFGYDAHGTDPLYKHVPLLINLTPQGCVGVFSTSLARGTWNVGSEMDGRWGHYKVYRQARGGLEEYLIVGKTVDEVVNSYAQLVGFPLLVPRYMMGYIAGGMKYSMQDSPRAADSILAFIDKCREQEMPVSAFLLSSGYTMAEKDPKTRNVFTWNRQRFPDPRDFTRECHRRGVRLLANVKPYVLVSHPAYPALQASGAFIRDPLARTAAVTRLWMTGSDRTGNGSHIDFTSKAGFDWWVKGCLALKDEGIDGMWNDDNEFNLPDDEWQVALETVRAPEGVQNRQIGLWGRVMHTELMAKGSHEACVAGDPDERPLVLTRSATAGTMRYACCSWSGDNVTSWENMKGGNALALNAAFSLLQCYGHDTGGCGGPQPSAELLVRWVQLGVHSPLFAINCFKTSPEDERAGDVIEPWQYEVSTPMVRDAIKRRYELVPYTYSLALKSHLTAVPPQRWIGWGYESDPEVWTEALTAGDTQYWFGDALLVAGVYVPGQTYVRVYLPRGPEAAADFGFINTNPPYEYLESGAWHPISATWPVHIPVMARCGAAVPVGKPVPTTSRVGRSVERREFRALAYDDWRGLEIFPPPLHVTEKRAGPTPALIQLETHPFCYKCTWLEDDGISSEALVRRCVLNMTYATGRSVEVGIAVKIDALIFNEWQPLWLEKGIDIILPVGEERVVEPWDETVEVCKTACDQLGRHVYNVKVSVEEWV